MDSTWKERMIAIEANAKARLNEVSAPQRDVDWFKRNTVIVNEPIFIGSSEDIGTRRARANHFDSVIDYFSEQEMLKKAGEPMPDTRKQTRITGPSQPDFTK